MKSRQRIYHFRSKGRSLCGLPWKRRDRWLDTRLGGYCVLCLKCDRIDMIRNG